mgnify:CR=1 FL=1
MNRHGAVILNRFDVRNSDELLKSKALSNQSEEISSIDANSMNGWPTLDDYQLERKNTANFGEI